MTRLISEISIIIPAYNEGLRLGPTLHAIISYFETNALRYEVIVVDDGSTDDTADVVASFAQASSSIRLISYPDNKGKGYAVRTGMLTAGYALLLTTDADLSTPIEEVAKLLACFPAADIAIGSRSIADAELRQPQPLLRRSLGMMFNRILRSLQLTRFSDTQCGFKLWESQAARQVFARCRINGFAYDVEALHLAEVFGFRIKEVGVIWQNHPGSKVNIITDSPMMLFDSLLIFIRSKFFRRL